MLKDILVEGLKSNFAINIGLVRVVCMICAASKIKYQILWLGLYSRLSLPDIPKGLS